jgi:hypothetical protein
MALIYKEKEKSTLGCTQNFAKDIHQFKIYNLCIQLFDNHVKVIVEHWAFICVMDAKKTSMHIN